MIPVARPPIAPTVPSQVSLPTGACDSHVHLFAGPDEFARDPERTEDPAIGDFAIWSSRLRGRMDILGLERAVLVHSVIYRENNAMTVEALRQLGDAFRGIALLRADVTEAELNRLHDVGFRGARLDLVYPGALSVEAAESLAPRLAARGWHLQLFGRWAANGDVIAELTQRLPCPVVLDHFAYPDVVVGTEGVGFQAMLRSLEGGRVWVKLSSLYRQDGPLHDRLDPFIEAAVATNPERVVWGSNWPHVRWDGSMPDETDLINNVTRLLSSSQTRRVFCENPALLYDFSS